ncbi:hypothetical protein [Pseudomonas syringae]
MKILITALIVSSLVTGCQSATPQSPARLETHASYAAQGKQSSEALVASLNRQYNDINEDCREIGTDLRRGHYYCSGLIVRGTTDGDYLPWTHSPNSMNRGATSFSWIRRDAHPKWSVMRQAGFILRNAVEGHRLGLPGYDAGFICLFPKDAGTGQNVRHNGCVPREPGNGVHRVYPQPKATHKNSEYAWGSRESFGITTLEGWIAYTGDMQFSSSTQCSWNADSQKGWRNSIAMQEHYPLWDIAWNELLMATVDDGYGLKDLISAVFVDSVDSAHYDSGIETARNFQRKLVANGSYAPIVRMDLSSEQPFSYHQEDQVIAR